MLLRLQRRLLGEMFDRYFWIARWLDYLDRRKVWWAGWVLMVGLFAFYGDMLATTLVPLYMLLAKASPGPSWKLYATLVELQVWLDALSVVMNMALLVVDGPPTMTAFRCLQLLAVLFAVVVQTYILADLFFPPRPRKKVKVSIRIRQPQLGRA
jgi:hypothetical protein